MTAKLPLAELHCHLEGTVSPEMARKLATRNGMTLPETIFTSDGDYAWTTFLEFLAVFDTVSNVIQTQRDYRDITYDYLCRSADEGLIYTEITISPDHARESGLPYIALIDAVAMGMTDAKRDTGIESRMTAICVRHLGAERAIASAKTVAHNPHPWITGFGMAGDEAAGSVKDFQPAFHIARDAGLACTAHAGEVLGPESVRDVIDLLPITRIGHGVRAVEDPRLVDEIVKRGLVLEISPGSNLALGVYKDISDHPLAKLRDAGCKVTLNSDDPPYFATTIGKEYEDAKRHFNLSDDDLLSITRNAIEGAFVDEATRQNLLHRLD